MFFTRSPKLLALVAILTATLSGCAIGKKDMATATYTSRPAVPPIEQLGTADFPEVPTRAVSAASYTGVSSSCGSGFS